MLRYKLVSVLFCLMIFLPSCHFIMGEMFKYEKYQKYYNLNRDNLAKVENIASKIDKLVELNNFKYNVSFNTPNETIHRVVIHLFPDSSVKSTGDWLKCRIRPRSLINWNDKLVWTCPDKENLLRTKQFQKQISNYLLELFLLYKTLDCDRLNLSSSKAIELSVYDSNKWLRKITDDENAVIPVFCGSSSLKKMIENSKNKRYDSAKKIKGSKYWYYILYGHCL